MNEKCSDDELARLKADAELWRNQAVKLDDIKQQMEVDHAVRINHFNQVIGKMERENSIGELKEKVECEKHDHRLTKYQFFSLFVGIY